MTSTIIGFTEDFAPSKWTIEDGGNNLVTWNEPTSVTLTSGNLETGDPLDTKLLITNDYTTAIVIKFYWYYQTNDDNTVWDLFGYQINDFFTQLSVDTEILDPQYGNETITVNPGDTFCFVQKTDDNSNGSATTTISNFEVILQNNNNLLPICFHPDSKLLVERDCQRQWITVDQMQSGDILTDDGGNRLSIIKLHKTRKTSQFVQINNNLWITPAHLLKDLVTKKVTHSIKFPLPLIEKDCDYTYHIETDGSKKYHFIPLYDKDDESLLEYAVEVWGKLHVLSKL